jgi:hypothetical protein
MTKRRAFRWSLILVILAAFAVWLEPTRVVWGWLRGEAFYQGRPTSWWAEELRPWRFAEGIGEKFARLRGVEFERIRATRGKQETSDDQEIEELVVFAAELIPKAGSFRVWISKWISLDDPTWPSVLDGDRQAESVLKGLQDNDDLHVRRLARIGVERLRSSGRGAVVRLNLKLRVGASAADIEQAIWDALGP